MQNLSQSHKTGMGLRYVRATLRAITIVVLCCLSCFCHFRHSAALREPPMRLKMREKWFVFRHFRTMQQNPTHRATLFYTRVARA